MWISSYGGRTTTDYSTATWHNDVGLTKDITTTIYQRLDFFNYNYEESPKRTTCERWGGYVRAGTRDSCGNGRFARGLPGPRLDGSNKGSSCGLEAVTHGSMGGGIVLGGDRIKDVNQQLKTDTSRRDACDGAGSRGGIDASGFLFQARG